MSQETESPVGIQSFSDDPIWQPFTSSKHVRQQGVWSAIEFDSTATIDTEFLAPQGEAGPVELAPSECFFFRLIEASYDKSGIGKFDISDKATGEVLSIYVHNNLVLNQIQGSIGDHYQFALESPGGNTNGLMSVFFAVLKP